MESAPPSTPTDDARAPRRSKRRWIVLAVAAVVLVLVLREVLNPYGDAFYLEVPHGNHVHYVPRDRDPDVPLDNFPTRPPQPGERVLPDGRLVQEAGGEEGAGR